MPKNWEAALDAYQREHGDADVWLLIDDIDAKYVDSNEYRTLISSFFSAIRGLALGVEKIKIRATVREDVWRNIRHFEDLDKVEQDHTFVIEWSKNKLKQMLVKRIYSYIRRVHPNSKESLYDLEEDSSKIMNTVFYERMPWGDRQEEPHIPIVIYSNHRPRWMGQLCKQAGKRAYEDGKNKIGIREINGVMKKFGRDRVVDLMREYSHQFVDIETLVGSFTRGARKYKYSELIQFLEENYIHSIGTENIPDVDSRSFHSPDQLGDFLFKIGLITGQGYFILKMRLSVSKPNLQRRWA